MVSGPISPSSFSVSTWLHVHAGQPHADVDADADAEVARELPVVPGDVGRRVARRARRERERQQLIVGVEVVLAHAPDVFGVLVRAVRPPLARRPATPCA